ncbi:unnamed protein product [Candida verbasci]|uniref:Nucleolar protein 58 n=1 Tax=Candida verbasci TaxID=1227364 RepID=A0A9W4U0V5_9ASCO|nr:unnamed protein product [Candida verbasci]
MAYVLTETAAGYALLKASDKKVHKSSSLIEDLNTLDKVSNQFKITGFEKFSNASSALEEINSIIEGKVSENLKNFLSNHSKDDKKSTLIVSETKLGNSINKLGLNFQVISDAASLDLHRAIKNFLPDLLPGLNDKILNQMSLGLAHSIGRHKLKFSADKVDTMIIQAIALLDDLDKELNTYAMRCKEWYGWHFPELAKMITDSVAYARIILHMGIRSNASTTDLSKILPEELEEKVKQAAEISMGTEITDDDLNNIKSLAEQIIDFAEYRVQLSDYLQSRMTAIAPNLSAIVGHSIGARLIAHAGSLTSLAKAPASTIQILGAEKALFRALKTKHDTPKYGILYHASLVGQATGKNKGRIARVLAAKAAISLRYDCFDEERDDEDESFGLENRSKVENRLSQLEGRDLRTTTKINRQQKKIDISEARAYNADADAPKINDNDKIDSDDEESETEEVVEEKKEKKDKKNKKEKKDKKDKKEKKRKREEEDDDDDEESSKKSKKDKKEKKDKKDKKEKKDKKDKKSKKDKN